MELPTIICLKSVFNNKYLHYRSEQILTHGLLQFAGDNVLDPYAQFEVEKAKTVDGLVHIKSRYTNKYLVRWSPIHHWITASAHATEEDQTSWTCTLFKPSLVDGDTKKFRLLHVQLNHFACALNIGAPFDLCLFAQTSEPAKDFVDVFTVINYDSLFKIPKHVAFKGINGKYLGASKDQFPGLKFLYDNANDPNVGQQVFQFPDGSVCIKSDSYQKFWRVGYQNVITVDAEDPRNVSEGRAIFRPTLIDINVVALMGMKNQAFCSVATQDGYLSAVIDNVTEGWPKLEVIDLGN